MITIGIDPGQTGALASMENGQLLSLHDMPTCARLHGKGPAVDPYRLSSILLEMKDGKEATVIIEQVSAMPGNGGTSMFHFGESVGMILGACACIGLPIKRVCPQHWKKRAGIIGKEKDAARTLAIQSHPDFSDMLARKKDCGRADAILIAEFGA